MKVKLLNSGGFTFMNDFDFNSVVEGEEFERGVAIPEWTLINHGADEDRGMRGDGDFTWIFLFSEIEVIER